jgi:class 3 adenylate cyclase/tetratricopeptide (TPR) repeat protein
LEGERKQVTVLFADLKGSMELLADRDPEEAMSLLDPVLERMMEAVHRYEGTVNQVMGDGIMALFGAPVAQEDHAVRACYAALRMQETVQQYGDGTLRAHGVPIRMRVGLNSGDVVVRSIGSDLRMDYSAVGQTTHLAARMEQLAEPGTILLSAGTLALAEGFVQVAARGPVPVKGLVTPVEIFQLTGASSVRSRVHAAASRGLTPFVGRDAEMALLRRSLALAGQGQGQVVAIVGEPGVGKSRMVWEFTHSHRTQDWLVLETTSVSYSKASTYFPVIELLRGYFAVDPRDDARKIREKVTGKLLSLDRAMDATLPVFLSLLDIPVEDSAWTGLDPSQQSRQVLDGLKRLVQREGQVQPVLLIIEDLHWIDAATQVWLDLMVESLPTTRLLLLVNHRPDYVHAWGSKTYYQQIRLDTLEPATAGELLTALLGEGPGLEDLRKLLFERTEGNPFFLEESVRALGETNVLAGERGAYRLTRPIPSLELPATAQAILAARIDRLAPEDKRLLQAAAVVGKNVPYPLLAAIAEISDDSLGQGLGRLQAAEFLYEAGLFPEIEYTFKHALTHEVAYGSLLQGRRSVLHAGIARAIERLYASRLTEHVERLAHHSLRGELWESAVHYLREAGRKATARSAPQEACDWFEQALTALSERAASPETLEQAFEVRLELRLVLSQLGDYRRALARMREAETLAEQLNDDRRRARAGAFVTNVHLFLGELEEAHAAGTRALEIAERLGDPRLRIPATSFLEQVYYFRGEYERVIELATANLAALPADWVSTTLVPAAIQDRTWLVRSLAELGRFAAGSAYEAEVIRLAEPTQHAYAVGLAHWAAGTLHLARGDWSRARTPIEHCIVVLRTGHVVLHLSIAVASSAWVLAQLGETEEALIRLQEGEQLLEREAASGMVGRLGVIYLALGRAAMVLGRLDQAQALGDRALAATAVYPGFAAHVQHLIGDLATQPTRFDGARAETYYRQALALAEPRGMRPLVAHCHRGLGRVYQRTSQPVAAKAHFTTATTMYREMDMTYWLEKAEAESAAG